MLAELTLLYFLLPNSSAYSQPDLISKPAATPTASVSVEPTPSMSACLLNPLFGTLPTISTVEQMVAKLGKPEKLYVFRYGIDVIVVTVIDYLYPSKGVDFTMHTPYRRNISDPYRRDNPLDTYVCYPPMTVNERVAWRNDDNYFRPAYQDWL
ncbi:MAG: hypothetical protein WCD37_01210, partial [Chloroflexia bacterium]